MVNGRTEMPQHIRMIQAIEHLPNPVAVQRNDAGERIRRLGDFVVACVLLSLTFPLLALVAVAIKCGSVGPIFERRERVAPTGRRFALLTFRTTAHDTQGAVPAWAREPTRVGEFLRYTRMDALPLLINVLRGDIGVIEAALFPSAFWD